MYFTIYINQKIPSYHKAGYFDLKSIIQKLAPIVQYTLSVCVGARFARWNRHFNRVKEATILIERLVKFL
jgi:hypothetical protein